MCFWFYRTACPFGSNCCIDSFLILCVSLCFSYARARLFLLGHWPSNVQWQAKLKHSKALLPNTSSSSRHVTDAFSRCLADERAAPLLLITFPRDLTDLVLSSAWGSDLPPWNEFRKHRGAVSGSVLVSLACADYDLGVVREKSESRSDTLWVITRFSQELYLQI